MSSKHLGNQPAVAALYLRLSKEDIDKINRGDDSESIKNQRLLLTEEARRRGFVIGDIYSDEDYSGTDSTRPAFNRLIEDAKRKKFNAVLCKTQSRFTRDMEVSERYIHGLFPLLGIRFIGVVDHVDTDIKGNKKARQINALVNEWYVEDLSENIRAVYRNKMHQGQYLGSFALYGYAKDSTDHHKLVIDEEAAEVVRKIYQYCLEGYGAQNICHQLQEEGILTPAAYKQKKGMKYHTPFQQWDKKNDRLWSPATVKRILTNEMYIGTLVQGREKRISYKNRKQAAVPKEEWIRIPEHHEPIIAKEDFYKAQEILKLRRKCSAVSDKQKKAYPLAGKVFCKDCGNPMLRTGPKGTNRNYLRCRLAGKSKGEECTSHSINYFDLETKILEALPQHMDEICSDEKKYNEIAESIRRKRNNTRQELQEGLQNCDADRGRVGVSQEQAREFVKKTMIFSELTNELVYELIDSVEIGEKNEKKEQEIILHWKI